MSFLIVTGSISAIRSNFRAQSVVGGATRERATLVRVARLHGPFTVDLLCVLPGPGPGPDAWYRYVGDFTFK